MWTTLNQPRGWTRALVRARDARWHVTAARGDRVSPRCCMRYACACAHAHLTHIHRYTYICAHSRVYADTSVGSLLPVVCGSAVSHTRCYSCVTNACIQPSRTSVRGRTAARLYMHTRDGKCSKCTNLRRSPLEKGRPALGTRRLARTYVCTCVRRVQERGRRAQRHASSSISGELFLSSVLLVHFVVFSPCVRAKIPRTNRFPAFGQFSNFALLWRVVFLKNSKY